MKAFLKWCQHLVAKLFRLKQPRKETIVRWKRFIVKGGGTSADCLWEYLEALGLTKMDVRKPEVVFVFRDPRPDLPYSMSGPYRRDFPDAYHVFVATDRTGQTGADCLRAKVVDDIVYLNQIKLCRRQLRRILTAEV